MEYAKIEKKSIDQILIKKQSLDSHNIIWWEKLKENLNLE